MLLRPLEFASSAECVLASKVDISNDGILDALFPVYTFPFSVTLPMFLWPIL